MPPDHPPLDGLIVLGARLNREGKPGRVARLRLLYALDLWRERYPGSHIILSGGQRKGTLISEARAMSHLAQDWLEEHEGREARENLAPCLILEEASLNTVAAALNTLPLIKNLGLNQIGLVSDSLHIHRACYLFRRHFAPHRITIHPLPARGLLRHYWRQRRFLWLSKMALREGGAWLKVLGRHTWKLVKK
jgi:uncharacterized SAM-binding protein YcdF (DUF218 family)